MFFFCVLLLIIFVLKFWILFLICSIYTCKRTFQGRACSNLNSSSLFHPYSSWFTASSRPRFPLLEKLLNSIPSIIYFRTKGFCREIFLHFFSFFFPLDESLHTSSKISKLSLIFTKLHRFMRKKKERRFFWRNHALNSSFQENSWPRFSLPLNLEKAV